jgi:molecular chaperone HtpG
MENCTELIPLYLSFIKGVVDAPDLNLNISREILQHDTLVRNIRTNLVKKLLDMFANMEREKYEQFYGEFGHILKGGVSADFDNREKLASLLRYQTTKSDGKWTSLKEYVDRMKPDQNNIYYLTGDNLTMLLNSPHLEQLKANDYEVLLMTDPIDEWVIRDLHEFEKKSFTSAEKGDLDLNKIDDKKKDTYSALFDYIKSSLDGKIKEVRPSTHLKDSIACLSGDQYDMSAFMERVLKASGQEVPQTKRVLELNMDHPLLSKIRDVHEKNRDAVILKDYSQFLYDMAIISEGGKLENPSHFSKMIGELMVNSIADGKY